MCFLQGEDLIVWVLSLMLSGIQLNSKVSRDDSYCKMLLYIYIYRTTLISMPGKSHTNKSCLKFETSNAITHVKLKDLVDHQSK